VIRAALGGEPWCFPIRDIDCLDRDTIFEVYLTRKVVQRGKKKKKKPAPEYRAVFFAHGRNIGHSWLESEAEWQTRSKRSSGA
jgi:hypothetical protein